MDIRPIRNESDYDWALAEVEAYFDDEPALGSAAADRFAVLSDLIEAYEARVWPVAAADAVDAILEVMEQRKLPRAALGKLIGSRSRASEILNRKRPMTMQQAKLIHETWRIPAEVLLRSGAAAKISTSG